MKNTHQVYLISDSTGETLDRIFMALKAQFNNFDYDLNQFSFTRTENQISTILNYAKKQESPIILYTVVNSKLAKFLAEKANEKNCNSSVELLLTYEKTELWSSYHNKDQKLLCVFTCVNEVCTVSYTHLTLPTKA